MAWKVERWLSEVFPGEENIYSEYRNFKPRELAIVTAAVLDSALVELLTLRLIQEGTETESFLGLNGDGRAPVASFGARIQLGLLLGILTSRDAAILRTIKKIRNEFAHRTNVDFLSPTILKETTRLLSLWAEICNDLARNSVKSRLPENLDEINQLLPQVSEAGEGLLLGVFTVYHAYFHRMHSRVKRIGNAIEKKEGGESKSDFSSSTKHSPTRAPRK